MAWPKKRAGAKPVTTWNVEFVPLTEAGEYLTKRAAKGWFIFSVVPAGYYEPGGHKLCVTSCQKVYPKKDEE